MKKCFVNFRFTMCIWVGLCAWVLFSVVAINQQGKRIESLERERVAVSEWIKDTTEWGTSFQDSAVKFVDEMCKRTDNLKSFDDKLMTWIDMASEKITEQDARIDVLQATYQYGVYK